LKFAKGRGRKIREDLRNVEEILWRRVKLGRRNCWLDFGDEVSEKGVGRINGVFTTVAGAQLGEKQFFMTWSIRWGKGLGKTKREKKSSLQEKRGGENNLING